MRNLDKYLNEFGYYMNVFGYYLVHTAIWTAIVFLYAITMHVHNRNAVNLYFISSCVIIFLTVVMYSKTTATNKYSLEYNNKDKQSKDLVYMLLLVAVFYLIDHLGTVSRVMMFGDNLLPNDKSLLNDMGLYIPFFVSGVILAPIIEETIFRGYMYALFNSIFNGITKIRKKNKVNQTALNITYVIVSSALFSWLHIPNNIVSAIPYFISGVLFSCIFLITKRIWVGMILHSVNNSVAALGLVYKHENTMPLSQELISVIIAIVCLLVILKYYDKIKIMITSKPYF